MKKRYEEIKSDKPLTKSEKQVRKEIEMFGNTIAGVEMEYKESFTGQFDDRLMYATCILSDAQGAIEIGDSEMARQFINKAKYHINKVRDENK